MQCTFFLKSSLCQNVFDLKTGERPTWQQSKFTYAYQALPLSTLTSPGYADAFYKALERLKEHMHF